MTEELNRKNHIPVFINPNINGKPIIKLGAKIWHGFNNLDNPKETTGHYSSIYQNPSIKEIPGVQIDLAAGLDFGLEYKSASMTAFGS